jgi:DNA-binding IscR family transcriptional regulator
MRLATLTHSVPGRYGGQPRQRNVTLEDIIHAIEGDLSGVHGTSPEQIAYPGAAGPLRDVWLAVRSSLSAVLASVTLADVAEGNLPQAVRALARRSHPATERASP